jgi:predicted hotdog family 3-hydroxylacyl-ACP dehydratase
MKTFPPIKELIPHRHPMLFLDAVHEFSPAGLHASYEVSSERWTDPLGMPSYMGIEIIAQAVAAHNCLVNREKDRTAGPSLGLLLGTRRYASVTTHFAHRERLEVRITEKMQDESGFGAFDGVILSSDGIELARATVKAFRPPDFAKFISENRPV